MQETQGKGLGTEKVYPKPTKVETRAPWETAHHRVEQVEIRINGGRAYFHSQLEHPIVILDGDLARRNEAWLLKIANRVNAPRPPVFGFGLIKVPRKISPQIDVQINYVEEKR